MKQFSLTTLAASIAMMSSMVAAQTLPTEAAANAAMLASIGAPAAWAAGYTGKGSIIGFVDTGADLTNPDLKNVVLSKNPYGLVIKDIARGHGTSMISIAAGAKNGVGIMGVAYDATVIAYAGGISGLLFNSDVSNGIRWNADNNATVINLSLGQRLAKTGFTATYTPMSEDIYARKSPNVVDAYAVATMLPALQYATLKGSIVVMAAGNDGNPVPTSPANLAVKMDAAGNLILGGRAVIVGAVDAKNVIASFSNRAGNICQTLVGTTCTDRVQIKDYFLVAPGGGLTWEANALGGTKIVQGVGTSEATAFVSGGVAVIKQAWPTLKPEQIVQILLKTATDLGAPGVDAVYGNGLMNLDAATRPIGTLTLAKMSSVSTTQLAGGPILMSATGISGGIITKQSFTSGSVMQNTQVIDSEGRNFTADLTNGVSTSMQNYNPATVYSSLSETGIYSVELGNDKLINAMYSSKNMLGIRVGHKIAQTYMGIEVGNAVERNTILGSRGSGGLALGGANTKWVAAHAEQHITSDTSVYGSVGRSYTDASSVSNSMLGNFSKIVTSSWTVGMRQLAVLNDNDSLSFQVSSMPRIVSGSATVRGVTGYTIASITDEGAIATPIISSEKLNLASDYRQYMSSVSYARAINPAIQVQAAVMVQRDNAASATVSTVYVQYMQRF